MPCATPRIPPLRKSSLMIAIVLPGSPLGPERGPIQGAAFSVAAATRFCIPAIDRPEAGVLVENSNASLAKAGSERQAAQAQTATVQIQGWKTCLCLNAAFM